MPPKVRADQLLAQQGLAESREKAKRLIMAGQVLLVKGGSRTPLDKPGQQLAADATLEVRGQERFVSRGGHKLLTAIEEFNLDLTDIVALDCGASTGGFTDCMLQFGAKRVYAVDVGYGQLHEKLRQDERVVNIERTNLRHVEPDFLPEKVDFIASDVSFISLTKILPPALVFLKPGGMLVAMVKPQFELEPHEVGKGVVKDDGLRQKAVDKITTFCTTELELEHLGTVPSKILGPKGNQEFMTLFKSFD